jgi:hypothetical protein
MMSLNRKGVGVAQVFIFMLAAISFALILIFGYRAIQGFLSSGEEVQLVQFRTELDSSIKKIYTEYGSVREENYKAPSTYQKICFVNLEYPANSEDISNLKKENYAAGLALYEARNFQIEEQKSEAGYERVDENVFLSPSTESLTMIKVYHISIGNESDTTADYPYACVPIRNGAFSLILEGKGDRTKIYPHYSNS